MNKVSPQQPPWPTLAQLPALLRRLLAAALVPAAFVTAGLWIAPGSDSSWACRLPEHVPYCALSWRLWIAAWSMVAGMTACAKLVVRSPHLHPKLSALLVAAIPAWGAYFALLGFAQSDLAGWAVAHLCLSCSPVVALSLALPGALVAIAVQVRLAQWIEPVQQWAPWSLMALAVLALSNGAGRRATFGPAEDVAISARTDLRRAQLTPSAPFHVVLLGLDGADWRALGVLEPQLRHFARLRAEGATATLTTIAGLDSPAIWASIATGQLPDRHGISGFARLRSPHWNMVIAPHVANPLRLWFVRDATWEAFDSSDWRATPIWDQASKFGQSALVLNWWATSPVRPIDGILISDRAFSDRGVVCSGAHADQFYPANLTLAAWRSWCDAHPPGTTAPSAERNEAGPIAHTRDQQESGTVLTDVRDVESLVRSTWSELSPHRWFSLELLLLREIDVASHVFAARAPAHRPRNRSPSRHASWRPVVDAYRAADDMLGRLMAVAHDHTLIVVVSDHGWDYDERGHDRGPPGILGFWSPSLHLSQQRIENATVLDIAPTLAWLVGLPLPEDLPGRPLVEVLPAAQRVHRPPTIVGTWSKPSTSLPAGDRNDERRLQSLRALGYLQ